MERILGRYSDVAYALMRFVAGLLFIFHGTQKFWGWPGEREPVELLSRSGVAALIEVVGGAMIALGIAAGFAAFIASGLMAFAYFLVHAPRDFYPIVNRGELAILYCFVFLYIATRGSGKLSIDSLRRPRRKR
jgi:putative oxidoreductase